MAADASFPHQVAYSPCRAAACWLCPSAAPVPSPASPRFSPCPPGAPPVPVSRWAADAGGRPCRCWRGCVRTAVRWCWARGPAAPARRCACACAPAACKAGCSPALSCPPTTPARRVMLYLISNPSFFLCLNTSFVFHELPADTKQPFLQ